MSTKYASFVLSTIFERACNFGAGSFVGSLFDGWKIGMVFSLSIDFGVEVARDKIM